MPTSKKFSFRIAKATLLKIAVLTALVGTTAYAAFNFYTPIGTHDVANCSTLAGWARDADTTGAIQVHVYRGAPFPYGQYVTATVANRYRSDLPFADKNHGFSIPTPNAFKTGRLERVYIHAINVDTDGNIVYGANNPLLTSTGKLIYCY
ncbi:MAG: hypothetical protein QNK37_31790 [Acidobacteriota bacterium]|nr:hypothetical protein [Acidobacteriota bacterium]